jgi:hypothetical protein
MYNIHQHNSIRRMHENRREDEEKYTRYLLRHAGNYIAIQSLNSKHWTNRTLNYKPLYKMYTIYHTAKSHQPTLLLRG